MERLKDGGAYGADAVYPGGHRPLGAWAFAGNFAEEELYRAVAYCRAHGVDTHVTINTMPRCDEVKQLPRWLETLEDAGVSGGDCGGPGRLPAGPEVRSPMSRSISPPRPVSATTRPPTPGMTGASRVVLAREVPLADIREIRAKTPRELEIEAFVHGAMCVSYSGRCLLSNYMTGRDSSRGAWCPALPL